MKALILFCCMALMACSSASPVEFVFDSGAEPEDSSVADSGSNQDSAIPIHDSQVTHDSTVAKDSAVIDSTVPADTSTADTATVDSAMDATVLFDSAGLPYQMGITYNGGPVMTGLPVVYFLWYGDWSNNTATSILPTLMANLSAGTSMPGQQYLNIVTTYYDIGTDGGLDYLTGKFTFGGSTFIPATQTLLQESDIGALTANYAASAGLTPAQIGNGIFFVLTASDIQQQAPFGSFCNDFCGWHNTQNLLDQDGGNLLSTQVYAFVGDPDTQCPTGCEQSAHLGMSVSPNGNPGADGMASVIMHELAESLTDPQLNAWTDFYGEIGDVCAWTFGTVYTTSNGAQANIKIGSEDYLLQQLLDNATGNCVMAEPLPKTVNGL
jgi:hypothetical protein